MADVWTDKLQEATFGGIRLDIVALRDDVSRDVVEHKAPGRDGARLDDMGLDLRRTSATLIFFERRGVSGDVVDQLDHLDRLGAFLEVHRAGAADFTHPIFGTYRAVVARCSLAADPNVRDAVMLDVEFLEDTETTATTPRSRDPIGPGAVAVAAAAAAYDVAALEAGATTELGARAIEAATTWETDPDLAPVEIGSDVDALSSELAAESRRLESEDDLELMPTIRALNQLHDTLRGAAEVALARRPGLVEQEIVSPGPLRLLLAEAYGGDAYETQAAFDLVLRMNRISDPLLVPGGARIVRPSGNRRGLNASTR